MKILKILRTMVRQEIIDMIIEEKEEDRVIQTIDIEKVMKIMEIEEMMDMEIKVEKGLLKVINMMIKELKAKEKQRTEWEDVVDVIEYSREDY